MKNKIIKTISLGITLSVIIFLLAAFIKADINPLHWQESTRFFTAVLIAGSLIFSAVSTLE